MFDALAVFVSEVPRRKGSLFAQDLAVCCPQIQQLMSIISIQFGAYKTPIRSCWVSNKTLKLSFFPFAKKKKKKKDI